MKEKRYDRRKLFVNARGAKKEIPLDPLECRILLEAQKGTIPEIAKELGVLPMQVAIRILRSIPAKLHTRDLNEARIRYKKKVAIG